MERVLTFLKSGGLFIFLAKNHSKKTIQMKSSESIFCKKMGLFRFFGGKNFSVAAREDGRDVGCACLI